MEQQIAVTLASAIIAASGRPHSIQEALDLVRDVQFAMYPNPNSAAYLDWKGKVDLTKVHD